MPASSRRLSAVPVQAARPAGQMSHVSAFDGRGRGAAALRRVQVPPVVGKHAAVAFWADLVARRCGTREACAVHFGVTFQTACNWFDGFSCPTGDKVMQALADWPEDFAALAGER